MDLLTRLANKYGTDKGTREYPRHNYTSVYHRFFNKLRMGMLNLLEIGIKDIRFPGASIKMWQEYFPKALIYGFDKSYCRKFENDRVKVYRGDQGNREDLTNCMNKFNVKYHIIIDDGSHLHRHQMITLGCLFPYIIQGGYYFIEDLHARAAKGTRGLFKNIILGKIIDLPMKEKEQDYLYKNMGKCGLFCSDKLLMIRKKK